MNEFRRCLEQLDVPGIRTLWACVSPQLPQPADDAQALIALHHARTQAESIPLKLRAYSHRWLLDQGHPSGLPDALKPKADRIYPRIVQAVAIGVRAGSPERVPLARRIQSAMEYAVQEAFADGRTEPGFVQGRMFEARRKVLKEL
jgi:hypothetical protein